MDTSPNISPARIFDNRCELSRLLSAAVVSRSFRELLLADPQTALHSGYQGETFHLDTDETNWLLSTRATNITDFAAQMVAFQKDNCYQQSRIPVELPRESAYVPFDYYPN